MSDLLDTVQERVHRLLVKHGVEDGVAGDEAHSLCAQLCREFGGSEYYIPTTDRGGRRRAVKADLEKMGSQSEVAKKHGISQSTVSRYARSDQQQGFGSPEWEID